MAVDVIIKEAGIVHAYGLEPSDIAIDNGTIVEIGPGIRGSARTEIDGTNQILLPGVIDSHVHFNEPGRADWEGIATGSAALAAGGGTTFFDMPLNSHPPVLNGETFDAKLAIAKATSHADFAIWGGLTPLNLDRMGELADRGVVGFKAFMSNSGIDEFPRTDSWTLYEGMKKAAELGLPVAVHAENQDHVDGAADRFIAQGMKLDASTWSTFRPFLAEVEAVIQALLIAHATKCKLHVVHVSTITAAKYIQWWKRDAKVDVTCETCPHYLALQSSDVERLGAIAKCAPPIRGTSTDPLWEMLTQGGIDTVGSDHSPSLPEMKTGDFAAAWGGIAGVQSTLPILLTDGYLERGFPLSQLVKVIAENPANRFGISKKGKIAVGYDADVCLVDLSSARELESQHLLQRHKISPYIGRNLHGIVRRTILRGQTVYLDGKIVAPPSGRFVRPA